VLSRRPVRVLVALGDVVLITFVGCRVIPVNATTVGFAYLLLILIVASTSGFVEAALSSLLATLLFNFFFLPPVGTFTVADPLHWVALFSFLATSLIASRLSTKAKARASEAIERQRDLERLYAFSRAMLVIDRSAPFAKQLVEKLVEIFNLGAAVLYERHTGESYCVGISGPEGLEDDLRHAALPDGPSTEGRSQCVIVGVRRGSEPVASMALRGSTMPDSVRRSVATPKSRGILIWNRSDKPLSPTAGSLYRGLCGIQCCLGLAGDLTFCD
jgi:two-component system, OmpR family, sensor histidine kinase KdpD